MAQRYYGSISLTELKKRLGQAHSAFIKTEKGNIYANVTIWVNDEPDKYGNTVSISLQSTKEKRESEEKSYIGNAKLSTPKDPEGLKPDEASAHASEFLDDLPF
jgi:hypothetical protein